MFGLIKSFSNPFGSIYVIVIGIFITRAIIKKIRQRGKGHVSRKVFICKASFCLFIVVALQLGFGNFSWPSKVDISPLKQLEAKSLYSNDEFLELFGHLEYNSGVSSFEISFPDDGDGSLNHAYGHISYIYSMGDSNASVMVSSAIYNSPEIACESFDQITKMNYERKRIVKISDDIDVILYNSRMYRVVEQLALYDDNRSVNTKIRIGNIIIHFYEEEKQKREIGALTSKNITLICEMLA